MSMGVDTALPVGDLPSILPCSGLVGVVGMVGIGLAAAGGLAVEVVRTIVYALFARPVRCVRSLHYLP